ncbi:peroxiredoxin family protein [Acidobacteriia bacterium AH_259_A11_L15]|nr:peroxiredoxin family protein [Acidobacteriia bacterium AH_259_A11_L15]
MKRHGHLPVPAGWLGVVLLAFCSNSWAQLPTVGGPPTPAKQGPQVGEKAPDFSLPDQYGAPTRLSDLLAAPAAGQPGEAKPGRWVLLVFYRGYWCTYCNADLRSLQDHLEEFTSRGVRLVAVSVDPPLVTRRYADKQGFSLTFLSDPPAQVIRRYHLLREGSGDRQDEVARPAQFLIDSAGTIRWLNLSEDMSVRVRPQDILKVIDELLLASSPGP